MTRTLLSAMGRARQERLDRVLLARTCVQACLVRTPQRSTYTERGMMELSRITPSSHPESQPNTAVRVMFFGRHSCHYSDEATRHLSNLWFDVESVISRNRGERLPAAIQCWQGEYIFCFRSYFKLPQALLDRATIAAINFHPGPSEYPGSGCANWALYENSPTYGVTAHLMDEKIDSGRIVECRRFPILRQDNIDTLLAKTHLKAYDLLLDVTTGLASEGESFLERKLAQSASERWSGTARRMRELDRLQLVDTGIEKDDLERVIRSAHTSDFPVETRLHGHRFVLRP